MSNSTSVLPIAVCIALAGLPQLRRLRGQGADVADGHRSLAGRDDAEQDLQTFGGVRRGEGDRASRTR
jgi:hypothetical protein